VFWEIEIRAIDIDVPGERDRSEWEPPKTMAPVWEYADHSGTIWAIIIHRIYIYYKFVNFVETDWFKRNVEVLLMGNGKKVRGSWYSRFARWRGGMTRSSYDKSYDHVKDTLRKQWTRLIHNIENLILRFPWIRFHFKKCAF